MHEDPPDLEPIDLANDAPGWYADPWTAGPVPLLERRCVDCRYASAGPAVMTASPTAPGDAPTRRADRCRCTRRLAIHAVPRIAAIVAGLVALGARGGRHRLRDRGEHRERLAGRRPPATALDHRAGSDGSRTRRGGSGRAAAGLVVQQADVEPTAWWCSSPTATARPSRPSISATASSRAEKLRVARLQVVEVDNAGTRVLLSTEAVTYRNAAATAAGFAELRKVRAACPQHAGEEPGR